MQMNRKVCTMILHEPCVDEYCLPFSVVLSTNVVVLFTNHLLLYYSSPKTSEDPHEHRRQRKIARRQHIKRTLQRLRDSDNLFLDDSITLAEDERTSLAKADETDKKRMAINAAHTKRGTPSIGLAQRGRNAAYSLSSAFNRTIKKINKNKHQDN